MFQEYENNIIPLPLDFRDDYQPPSENIGKPVSKPETVVKSVSAPETKITLPNRALKGVVQSYKIGRAYEKDPLAQLNNTALSFGKFI